MYVIKSKQNVYMFLNWTQSIMSPTKFVWPNIIKSKRSNSFRRKLNFKLVVFTLVLRLLRVEQNMLNIAMICLKKRKVLGKELQHATIISFHIWREFCFYGFALISVNPHRIIETCWQNRKKIERLFLRYECLKKCYSMFCCNWSINKI